MGVNTFRSKFLGVFVGLCTFILMFLFGFWPALILAIITGYIAYRIDRPY